MRKYIILSLILTLTLYGFSAIVKLTDGSQAKAEVLSITSDVAVVKTTFGQQPIDINKIAWILFDEENTSLLSKKGIVLKDESNFYGEIQSLSDAGGLINLKYGILKLNSNFISFINFKETDPGDFEENFEKTVNFSILPGDEDTSYMVLKNGIKLKGELKAVQDDKIVFFTEYGSYILDRYIIQSIKLSKEKAAEYNTTFLLKDGSKIMGKIIGFNNNTFVFQTPVMNMTIPMDDVVSFNIASKDENNDLTTLSISGKIVEGKLQMTSEKRGEFLFIAKSKLPEINGIPVKTLKFSEKKNKTFVDPRTGIEFVYIPAGTFIMGALKSWDKYDDDELPAHEVYLDAYYISKYPVTVEQYAKFLQISYKDRDVSIGKKIYYKTKKDIFGNKWYYDYTPQEEYLNYPITYVNWYSAMEFAKYAGYSLPTEAQWEKAARGTDGRRFPWGNEYKENYANENKNAYYPVDQFENTDISPFGVVNMYGYPVEIVYDKYSSKFYSNSPRSNPVNEPNSSYKDEEIVVRSGVFGKRITYRGYNHFYNNYYNNKYNTYYYRSGEIPYTFRIVIPAGKVEEIINKPLRTKKLGIGWGDMTNEIKLSKNLATNKGVLITVIRKGSPAQLAGFKEDDIIVAINGKEIKNMDELNAELENYNYGDKVTFTVYRGQEKLDLIVEIGVWNY